MHYVLKMSITLMQETCLWNLAEWKQVERVQWSPKPPIPRRARISLSLPSREEEEEEGEDDDDDDDDDDETLTLTLILLPGTSTVIMITGVKEAKFYPRGGNSK